MWIGVIVIISFDARVFVSYLKYTIKNADGVEGRVVRVRVEDFSRIVGNGGNQE